MVARVVFGLGAFLILHGLQSFFSDRALDPTRLRVVRRRESGPLVFMALTGGSFVVGLTLMAASIGAILGV